MLNKFFKALDSYDPYGFMRVSGLQMLTMVLVMFVINFLFSPFNWTSALQFPLFGMMACGMERSFNSRIRNVAIFCMISMLYAFLFCLVKEYRILLVLLVGSVVFGLFMLSKYKYPYLLGMIAMIQILITTSVIPRGANFTVLLNYGISYMLASVIGLLVMYVFPRKYFFRVWLRIVYATLGEFESRFRRVAEGEVPIDKLTFVHFIEMYEYTPSLSYRENGIFARKFALLLVAIYAYTVVTYTKVEPVNPSAIHELADACHQLRKALGESKKLASFNFMATENNQLMHVQKDFNWLLTYWNRACLKI